MFSTVIQTFHGLVALNNTLASIKVVPSDFKGTLPAAPFLKLHVVFSLSALVSFSGAKAVTGLLKIAIFTKSGSGQLSAATISSSLDSIFEKKLLTNDIQTYASSLQFVGADPKDPSLSISDYTVPFSYYGE